MKLLTIEEAENKLKQINNNLTLLMREKNSYKEFIKEEQLRIDTDTNPRLKAIRLKTDKEFIELYGRARSNQEIARLMNYSERQIRRFLKEDD